MADAEVQAKKVTEKVQSGTSTDNSQGVYESQNKSKGKAPAKIQSKTSNPQAKGSSSNTKAPPSQSEMNLEITKVLIELKDKMTKQNVKIDDMSKKFNDYDLFFERADYYDEEYVDHDDESSVYSGFSGLPSVSQAGDHGHITEDVETDSSVVPPPAKRLCTEGSEVEDGSGSLDVFANLVDIYQKAEKTDVSINENLASFVNRSFYAGMSDDSLGELLKDIHRPGNCESLVKTKVNGSIWRLLKSNTQTDDIKSQNLQNVLIKASCNIVKMLDHESGAMKKESIDLGTSALALLGQANKQINNRRKELHRWDLDPKYHPLTSPNLPYSANLYGDDINKNVKDIQDMSRLGRSVGRGSGGAYSLRGRARGRGRGTRGRGMRGSYRPGEETSDNRQYGTQGYGPFQRPKNPRQGHRK